MRFFVLSLIGFVLFGFLAHPLLLNQVPIEYDLGRYHLPLRDFYQRCLHNGDDPAWCPHLFCGYDLHGEGQAGMDHPWHRLLYSMLPLTIAFNIEIFANYPFLCLGMYLFLRRHRLPPDAALVGALTATFGGFTLPHYAHTNAIAIVAHMPWLLWATNILWNDGARQRRATAAASIAALTGSQILLGYPQYVYFSCLAEGMYVLLLFIQTRTWTPLATWLAFKILGIAIGGAQLLPSLHALQLSPRVGYDAHFRGMLSLPWEMLLQLVAPTQFNVGTQLHEYTVYGGALATLGTLWFVARGSWIGRNLLNRFAFWLIVIAVALALGRHTPLFQFYLKLPIVGVFRCPCRYLVLSHFAAAIIVARLIQQLGEPAQTPRPWRQLIWLLGIPILSWAAVMTNWTDVFSIECQKFLSPKNQGALGATSLTLATLLMIAAGRGKFWALPLLLIVGFADLGYWGLRTIYGTHDTPVHTFVDLKAYQDAQVVPTQNPQGRLQIDEIHGNGAMMLGWSLTGGYVGLSPPRSLDYQTVDGLRLAATTWRYVEGKWQPIDGLPRLRWQNAATDISTDLKMKTNRPGQIEIDAGTNAPRMLVLAESFHPDWHATIDGDPAEITRADGDFQGCMVPAGKHRVVFHFDPVYRSYGRWLSWAGVGLALIAALWLGNGRESTMIPMATRGDV